MLRTGATIIALGVFLTAAPPTLAQGFATYGGAYPAPPGAGFSTPHYGPPCYASITKRERDKGMRHWTGLCGYRG